MKSRTIIIPAAVIIAVVGGMLYWQGQSRAPSALPDTGALPDEGAMVAVRLPTSLTQTAITGRGLFEAKCMTCHGRNAAGKDGSGPPLIHIIYEPSHHGDESFRLAALRGTRAHHWRFGDMPPVEGITGEEITAIIAYIREVQRANGIK